MKFITDITFHEENHTYVRDSTGEIYPSVTSILKHNDVDGLMRWASRKAVEAYGRAVRDRMTFEEQRNFGMLVKDIQADSKEYQYTYEAERDAAAEIGTTVHEGLFSIMPEGTPRGVLNAIEGWHNFLKEGAMPEFLAMEEIVALHRTEGLWNKPYAGMFDLYLKLGEEYILADIKTSNFRDDSWAAQLGGYCFGLEKEGHRVDRLWIIHLSKSSAGDYDIHEVGKQDAYDRWFASLNLYYANLHSPYKEESLIGGYHDSTRT